MHVGRADDALAGHWCNFPWPTLALQPTHVVCAHTYPPALLLPQVVSNQLSGMTAERQELADQVKLHSTRCHYNEQLARAREQDVSGGWTGWVAGRRAGAHWRLGGKRCR